MHEIMRRAFFILHIGILLAGFTGLFGRLITLHETTLVWYRMLFASLCLLPFVGLPRIGLYRIVKISLCGGLLGLHWILFYGSIKLSNVSIGTVCFALIGFFTALIEPLVFHRRISKTDLLFSCLTLAGILCIFSLDARYRSGIIVGTTSSFVAAIYSVMGKKMISADDSDMKDIDSRTTLLYQILGGFIVVSALIPIYLYFFPTTQQVAVIPTGSNLFYLITLASFCTALLYLCYIISLRHLSAFTVSLSYNLEPIYTIVLAFIVFGEGREVGTSFYIGISLIVVSVALQTMRTIITKQVA